MHTYRKDGDAWQVGYLKNTADFIPVGPTWDAEHLAAAFASFLNGGDYSPYDIAPMFPQAATPDEDDDSTHLDRPKELEDYPIARKRK